MCNLQCIYITIWYFLVTNQNTKIKKNELMKIHVYPHHYNGMKEREGWDKGTKLLIWNIYTDPLQFILIWCLFPSISLKSIKARCTGKRVNEFEEKGSYAITVVWVSETGQRHARKGNIYIIIVKYYIVIIIFTIIYYKARMYSKTWIFISNFLFVITFLSLISPLPQSRKPESWVKNLLFLPVSKNFDTRNAFEKCWI